MSIWLVPSSTSKILLLFNKVRARTILCFSPPLKLNPFSSIKVSKPNSFFFIISSTKQILAVLIISYELISLPSFKFSNKESVNSNSLWEIYEISFSMASLL